MSRLFSYMDTARFEALEVKPSDPVKAWYYVTVYQFNRPDDSYSEYFKEWFEFDGHNWLYDEHDGNVLVCFIHKRESEKPL